MLKKTFTFITRVLFCVSLVLLGSRAYAGHDDMKYFAGKWSFRVHFASDQEIKGEWFLESCLDSNFCMNGWVTLAGGQKFTRELMHYNAGSRLYVRTIIANEGSSFYFTSSGWKGQKLIWTGQQTGASGAKTGLKEEITRITGDSFHAVYYTKRAGAWIKTQDEYLERAAP